MQREIKFKAKREDTEEWVYGYYIKVTENYLKYSDFNKALGDYIITKNNEFIYVIPETICEYTGLKDKNGVGIYENDIVFYSDFATVYKDDITGVVKYTQDCMFEIEYDDKYTKGGKTTRPLVCHEHPIFTSKKIEVIENIYDKEVK